MVKKGWLIETIASGNFAIFTLDDENALDSVIRIKNVLNIIYGDRVKEEDINKGLHINSEYFQDIYIDKVHFNICNEYGITTFMPYEADGNKYIFRVAQKLNIDIDKNLFINLSENLLNKTGIYSCEYKSYITDVFSEGVIDLLPYITLYNNSANVTMHERGKITNEINLDDLRKVIYIILYKVITSLTQPIISNKYSDKEGCLYFTDEVKNAIYETEMLAFNKIGGVYEEWFLQNKNIMNV